MADDAVDFISSLPDEIIHHIFSFIRTKLAIRTSVLSKRWKHVWSKTPSLLIDSFTLDPSSLKKILTSYSAPKITSCILIIVEYDTVTSQIDSWIELAMSRNAENLTLDLVFQAFRFPESFKYRFPESFFNNSSLMKLDVSYYDMTPTCIVSWTSLRNLTLNSCKLSDEYIANILAGCSMLESLMISSCSGLHHLDLSKSVNLRRLEISGRGGPVEIVAPHIHYLSLANSEKPSTLVDVSSLTEANLHLYRSEFEFSEFDFVQDMVVKMLAKLQNIEKLTVTAMFLQVISLAELCGVPFPQLKIKALVVETMIVRSIIPGITRLIQNSLGLKEITVYTMKCCTIPDTRLDEYLKWKGLDPEQCWRSEYGVFPTTEETKDAMSKHHEASFENLVKGNTKTLETMVIRLPATDIEKESEKFNQMLEREIEQIRDRKKKERSSK